MVGVNLLRNGSQGRYPGTRQWSESVEHGNGSRSHEPGAVAVRNAAARCVVEGTGRVLRRAPGIRHLRLVGCLRQRALLHRPVFVAVLLALPGQQLRPSDAPGDRRLVDPVAGVADPSVPPRVSAHVLLLPQGLLPLVLAIPPGVRGGRAPPLLYGGDAFPADPSEHSPLFLLCGAPVPDHPLHRRCQGFFFSRRLRTGARHGDTSGERRAAGCLHNLLPFLSTSVRRVRRCSVRGTETSQAVAFRLETEPPSWRDRVGQPVRGRPHRRLRAPGVDGRDQRPEALLMTEREVHEFDVIVIGAGGAGLRAAIEARAEGASTALICKSLLGKAHTVMAEGGVAAALGTVYPEDNWEVHFRDTIRGGKMLNNWRMAQIHAREAPERVLELEEWGALFDRTGDGRILQRDFGGHRYARLAHVGDRTGLEMIRVLQHKAVAAEIDVFMECTVVRLLKDGDRIAGAVAYRRESGKFVEFKAPAVVLATGGIGKAFKVTSNSWEYTGDGHALGLWAGADLIDMECVQFHPTGMVWPPSVMGILVTEGVRGDGGILTNTEGRRFMFDYITEYFKAETADSEAEGDAWYEDHRNNRRPPELLPRDEVARAINAEVKAGRGTEHGGVYLDIASRKAPDYIRKRLPSMYHQFKELAGVDITKEPMEVGPTCHYIMGGVRVDADTTQATVPGLFAAGEVAAGLHGSNRLGGNSLSDLVVFGRRAGLHAGLYAKNLAGALRIDQAEVESATRAMLEPFTRSGGENPYAIQAELQEVMQALVGIIRTESEMRQALGKIEGLKERARKVRVDGGRVYNPGWHTALDLASLLAVAECTTLAALERRESRGGHTRDDHPYTDDTWAKVNVVLRLRNGAVQVSREPLPEMPAELKALLQERT